MRRAHFKGLRVLKVALLKRDPTIGAILQPEDARSLNFTKQRRPLVVITPYG